MFNRRLMSLISALAFVAGCASGPGYQEVAASIPELSAESGRIYIYRIATMGAAIQPEVKLNEEVVGRAKPKGFFYVDRAPGSYVLSASTEAKRSLTFELAAGETKYVRLEVKMGLMAGHIKPVLVDPAEGQPQLEKTKAIGMDTGGS